MEKYIGQPLYRVICEDKIHCKKVFEKLDVMGYIWQCGKKLNSVNERCVVVLRKDKTVTRSFMQGINYYKELPIKNIFTNYTL